jgi:hypothetical protein
VQPQTHCFFRVFSATELVHAAVFLDKDGTVAAGKLAGMAGAMRRRKLLAHRLERLARMRAATVVVLHLAGAYENRARAARKSAPRQRWRICFPSPLSRGGILIISSVLPMFNVLLVPQVRLHGQKRIKLLCAHWTEGHHFPLQGQVK